MFFRVKGDDLLVQPREVKTLCALDHTEADPGHETTTFSGLLIQCSVYFTELPLREHIWITGVKKNQQKYSTCFTLEIDSSQVQGKKRLHLSEPTLPQVWMELLCQGGVRGAGSDFGKSESSLEVAWKCPSDRESFRKYYWLVAHRLQKLSDKEDIFQVGGQGRGDTFSPGGEIHRKANSVGVIVSLYSTHLLSLFYCEMHCIFSWNDSKRRCG